MQSQVRARRNNQRSSALQRLGPAFIGGGLLLSLLSFVVQPLADANPTWTEQQGRDLEAATTRLHALTHQHGHRENKAAVQGMDNNDELRQAQEKFSRLKAKLDKVRHRGVNLAQFAKWFGAGLVTVGAISYVTAQIRTSF